MSYSKRKTYAPIRSVGSLVSNRLSFLGVMGLEEELLPSLLMVGRGVLGVGTLVVDIVLCGEFCVISLRWLWCGEVVTSGTLICSSPLSVRFFSFSNAFFGRGGLLVPLACLRSVTLVFFEVLEAPHTP